MKTVIEPKLHDSVLEQWHGACAQIWMFHVSLRRLALRLSRPDESEVIYIVAVGCDRIVGPFSWKPANVSLIIDSGDQTEWVVARIVDQEAGFDLRCSSLAMARGPATDFDKTFDNFLGDAPDISQMTCELK